MLSERPEITAREYPQAKTSKRAYTAFEDTTHLPPGKGCQMFANDDVLLAVGRLNYVWTNTESLLIYVIAHLLKVEKEAAIVVFLTLNTTRARIDLVERLSKLPSTPKAEAETILSSMSRLKTEAKTRNKYNHCIYSFDESGQISSTQLMRLVENDKELKYGKVEKMDRDEIDRLEATIREITDISRALWTFIRSSQQLKTEAL